jgi:hypothetical protein
MNEHQARLRRNIGRGVYRCRSKGVDMRDIRRLSTVSFVLAVLLILLQNDHARSEEKAEELLPAANFYRLATFFKEIPVWISLPSDTNLRSSCPFAMRYRRARAVHASIPQHKRDRL